jgi:L-ribulokinase
VGDIFEAITRRANRPLAELSAKLGGYKPAQTGLLRLSWDNGDRTVLVNADLGGVTFGWNLLHTAEDELFAAIEGTALHTRIILERMAEGGVPLKRIINAGGIPQKNDVLNQIYADVMNKPVLVPAGVPTSLGSGIFAFLASGVFASIEAAQAKICLPYRTFTPRPQAAAIYDELFALYRNVYFALGTRDSPAAALGDVLPTLRSLASRARQMEI